MASDIHALLVRDVVAPLHHPRLVAACAQLLDGPLTARRIVALELIQWLPGAGEHHDAGTDRGGGARAERQRCSKGRHSAPPPHGIIVHLRLWLAPLTSCLVTCCADATSFCLIGGEGSRSPGPCHLREVGRAANARSSTSRDRHES